MKVASLVRELNVKSNIGLDSSFLNFYPHLPVSGGTRACAGCKATLSSSPERSNESSDEMVSSKDFEAGAALLPTVNSLWLICCADTENISNLSFLLALLKRFCAGFLLVETKEGLERGSNFDTICKQCRFLILSLVKCWHLHLSEPLIQARVAPRGTKPMNGADEEEPRLKTSINHVLWQIGFCASCFAIHLNSSAISFKIACTATENIERCDNFSWLPPLTARRIRIQKVICSFHLLFNGHLVNPRFWDFRILKQDISIQVANQPTADAIDWFTNAVSKCIDARVDVMWVFAYVANWSPELQGTIFASKRPLNEIAIPELDLTGGHADMRYQ